MIKLRKHGSVCLNPIHKVFSDFEPADVVAIGSSPPARSRLVHAFLVDFAGGPLLIALAAAFVGVFLAGDVHFIDTNIATHVKFDGPPVRA